jgi:hypothetical protein
LKSDALQVEIRPRDSHQVVVLAAKMIHHRPGPLLAAWALYSGCSLALVMVLFFSFDLNPWWVWALTLVFAPLFSLPLVSTIGHLVFSPSVSFGAVMRMIRSRALPFALLFLVNRLLTLGGLALLLLPGLYLWRSSWFLGPIALLEGAELGASFRRGRRFAIGFQGRVFAQASNLCATLVYLSFTFAAILHFFLVQVLGLTFTSLAGLVRYEGYNHLLGLVGFSLALPFVTLVWFFVYLDVRIRKEGWDLEIAFRSQRAKLERHRG